jgi:hypothetical protein
MEFAGISRNEPVQPQTARESGFKLLRVWFSFMMDSVHNRTTYGQYKLHYYILIIVEIGEGSIPNQIEFWN